jgi:hypothetical protein
VRVVYRKGELSKATIDRDWPHQVALPAYRCLGHNYLTMHLRAVSPYPRTRSLRQDGQVMTVFCFAERNHGAIP